MANLLFAKELARRFAGTRKTANAVHPGAIRTNLAHSMGYPRWAVDLAYGIGDLLVFKSVAQGAATECYVAVNPGTAKISGAYWVDCNVREPRADANDPVLAAKLWEASEKIVARLN